MQSENNNSNECEEDFLDNDIEFNSQEAVESVYSAEAIEVVDCVNAVAIILEADTSTDAANEAFTEAEIYSLDCARMAKHDRASERRSSKSRLSDRRLSARVSADGQIQPDRRAANRTANINAILTTDQSDTNK